MVEQLTDQEVVCVLKICLRNSVCVKIKPNLISPVLLLLKISLFSCISILQIENAFSKVNSLSLPLSLSPLVENGRKGCFIISAAVNSIIIIGTEWLQ